MSEKPFNFSWLEEGKLAGLGFPSEARHFKYLEEQGTDYLVSLTQEKPVVPEGSKIEHLHIPMKDFTAPSMDQIEEFLGHVDKAHGENKTLAVHCMMGQGRCGTMLACYLVRTRDLTGPEAVKEVRRIRPGSIETTEQEEVVQKFHLHNKKT